MEATDPAGTSGTLALLARGGLVVPAEGGVPPREGDVLLPRYNGLQDPLGAEELGRRLAAALRDHDANVVLIWQSPLDIVIGHVVARELSISAVRSYDRDGLVAYDGTFAGGGRVALVGDAFREAESVRAMCALAEQQGQEVVVAGALVAVTGTGTIELDAQGIALVSLVDMHPQGSRRGRHG